MQQASRISIFKTIPRTIWGIGVVTLLINASTIIIFSLFPLYLTSVFGANLAYLGRLEGVVEATAWFTRIFSGILSDLLHKRKPILLAAYGLAAFSRLIFPMAPNVESVFFARFVDRISNGLQATPREALVGDVAPALLKGSCYGLRQTLGTIGSFIGAFGLWYYWQGHNFRLAFWIAGIPALFSVFILLLFVQDRKEVPAFKKARKKVLPWQDIISLGWGYWKVLVVASIFMVSNYSGAFIILQGKEVGLCSNNLPLVMVLQNVMTFISAFPSGWLSDRIGRNLLLMVGFILVMISNGLMAQSGSVFAYFVGVAVWGCQMGMTQSLMVAKIADAVPEQTRGTGFGIYYLFSGVSVFISNEVAGRLAHVYSNRVVFYFSSVVALIALFSMLLWVSYKKKGEK